MTVQVRKSHCRHREELRTSVGTVAEVLRSPTRCSLTESAFKGTLTRTKTTGADKKVQFRALHVDRQCWLVHPDWMQVGLDLWQTSAPWERDFPYRPKLWDKYECKYVEATVLSRILEVAPGRLRREHSPRACLTSCTGCPRYGEKWQDAIEGLVSGPVAGLREYDEKARQYDAG